MSHGKTKGFHFAVAMRHSEHMLQSKESHMIWSSIMDALKDMIVFPKHNGATLAGMWLMSL